MSFNLTFEKDSGLIYVKVVGVTDLGSGAEILNRLASGGRFQYGILFDATETDYVPSKEQVRAFCSYEGWRKVVARYGVAIVVSKPIQYGIANIVARKGESGGGRVEQFYDVVSARAWLESAAGEKRRTFEAGS